MPTATARERLAAIRALCAHPMITTLDNGVTLCTKCHNNLHRGKQRDEYEV